MRFPVIGGTASCGSSQIFKPRHQMLERGDVVEAAVCEGRPVEALAGSQPADLAVQPVVVVVAGEAIQRGLGIGQRAEDLAIENLALERRPERLDLAIGPRRVHLGLDLADLQLAQRLAEAGEHAGYPVHELDAVVAHQVERPAAELDAVAQPDQDARDLAAGRDAQSEHVARVVVDQAEDPGLEVALAPQLDEERPLDVDVPKRVRAGALIARTALTRQGRAGCAEVVEELLDPAMTDLGDLAPAQLGRDALGVPVRVKTNGDDHLLQPDRMFGQGLPRAVSLRDERGEATGRVRLLPAPQRHATAPAKVERRRRALVASGPHHPGALPDRVEARSWHVPQGRSTTAGRQEAEARSFLERGAVTSRTPASRSLLVRRTSASRATKITVRCGSFARTTFAVGGVRASASTMTRSGSRPLTSRTVRAGSSASTVPMPTRTASVRSRRRCTSRRAGFPERYRRPGTATRPSTVAATFRRTNGRPRFRRETNPALSRSASARSTPSSTSIPAARSPRMPLPSGRGAGSRMATAA